MTASRTALRLPRIPAHCTSNDHMFYVLLPAAAGRDDVLGPLRAEDIHAVFHDIPLHTSPMGRRLGSAGTHLPVPDDLAARIVRLPIGDEMTEEEQERVADAPIACLPGGAPAQ